MAELENEDIIEDIEEETTQYEEVEETQEETWEEDTITWEQAMEWKKKAERLDKAEKALVEKKKAEKQTKRETKDIPTSRDEVKRLLAEEKFYDKNPEAEAYRNKIEKYQTKGLSLDDAYLLATRQDKEIEETRATYGKWIVKWNTWSDVIASISLDEFDRMTPQLQAEYTNKMTTKYWKVKFK